MFFSSFPSEDTKPFKNKGNAVCGLYNSKSICPVILEKPFTTEPTPFDNCILLIQLPGVNVKP